MMDKKNRVQILADIIQPLMQQIDLLTSALSTEDFDLLDEAKHYHPILILNKVQLQ